MGAAYMKGVSEISEACAKIKLRHHKKKIQNLKLITMIGNFGIYEYHIQSSLVRKKLKLL